MYNQQSIRSHIPIFDAHSYKNYVTYIFLSPKTLYLMVNLWTVKNLKQVNWPNPVIRWFNPLIPNVLSIKKPSLFTPLVMPIYSPALDKRTQLIMYLRNPINQICIQFAWKYYDIYLLYVQRREESAPFSVPPLHVVAC